MDCEQLGRPVVETGGVECPATGVTEPLSLRKVELGFRAFLIRSLAVVDIHARAVPLDDLAARTSQRQLLMPHPAVCTVRPSDTRFALERLAAGKARPPLRDQRAHVVRVDRRRPFPAFEILESQSHKLEPALVEEIDGAVGMSGVDEGGNGIDELLQDREVWGVLGNLHGEPSSDGAVDPEDRHSTRLADRCAGRDVPTGWPSPARWHIACPPRVTLLQIRW